ncbi:protein kinase [Streptomyces sp. NPDC002054]|uniref:serine/threonine-protein kinase n=1 Tax=Streptomyces sp. NPDC002054 TaxID=3154663 RepID=UPI00332E6E4B
MKRLAVTDPVAVGKYRTIAELGRGGMGRVLLSSAPDGKLVAVKQVRTQFVEDDGFRARFRREVEASRKVSGAYTSTIIDADADAPEPWLTSEFVPGPSLQQAVAAVGALPEEAILRMAAGLAAALVDIHRAGLVHRDLKPSNVLLAEDGPRVIDFGIARAADSEGGSELTHTGWLVGSPGFMSPEQARGVPLDSASDIFSLGTVLVMACTGACPFIGPAMPQTLYNIVHTDPDLSGVPVRIRPIVAGCLAKDPADRPSAAQLLEAIGRITPSERPWPSAVYELIEKQQAEIGRLQDELRKRPAKPVSPPAPNRRGFAIAVGIAAGIAVASVAIALVPGYGTGSDPGPGPGPGTIAEPRPTVTASRLPSDDPTTSAPRQPTPAPTTFAPEPSTVPEPSAKAPTTANTRPSRRPAAIASCFGEHLAEPASLLLACGDGKATLKGLTWSDWGLSTAHASGQLYEVVCQPNCANGTEVRSPATVTLTGLTGGRYTVMQIRAPRSPLSPVSRFTLDSNGPTRRS